MKIYIKIFNPKYFHFSCPKKSPCNVKGSIFKFFWSAIFENLRFFKMINQKTSINELFTLSVIFLSSRKTIIKMKNLNY